MKKQVQKLLALFMATMLVATMSGFSVFADDVVKGSTPETNPQNVQTQTPAPTAETQTPETQTPDTPTADTPTADTPTADTPTTDTPTTETKPDTTTETKPDATTETKPDTTTETKPETPTTDCTCGAAEGAAHQESCPKYQKPTEPLPVELPESVKSVVALIAALPVLDELNAQHAALDPNAADYETTLAAYTEAAAAAESAVKAAQEAFDKLSAEDQALVPESERAKLAALTEHFGKIVAPMAMVAATTPATWGPLRIFYSIDNKKSYTEVATECVDFRASIKTPAPSSFEKLYMKVEANEGYSFNEAVGTKKITDLSVDWQHTSTDGVTLNYATPASTIVHEWVIPASALGKKGDYDDLYISWKTEADYPMGYGTYNGEAFLASKAAVTFGTAKCVGLYTSDGGQRIAVYEEGGTTRTKILGEVDSKGAVATGELNDVRYSVDADGAVGGPKIKFGYAVNAYLTWDETAKTFTADKTYNYRKSAEEKEGTFTGVIAAETVFKQIAPVAINARSGVGYETLAAAVAGATAGDVINVAAGNHTEALVSIDKSITITGAGADKTTLNGDIQIAATLPVDAVIRINALKVESTNNAIESLAVVDFKLYLKDAILRTVNRGITYQRKNRLKIVLELDNTQILNSAVSDYDKETKIDGNARGIDLYDTSGDVTVKNGSAVKGFGYVINVSGKGNKSVDLSDLRVTIADSALAGWATFNIWGSGSTYTISNSTLLGINSSSGDSNSFATIVVNADIYGNNVVPCAENNTFDISNTTISNFQSGASEEQLFRIDKNGIKTLKLKDVTFKDTTGNIRTAFYSGMRTLSKADFAKYMDGCLATSGTITSTDKDGKPLPLYLKPTVFIGETGYFSISDAVTAATPGATITVTADADIPAAGITVDKNLTFVGQGTTKPVLSCAGMFTVTAGKLTMKNLELRLMTDDKRIIYTSNSPLDIQNCDFTMASGIKYGMNAIYADHNTGAPTITFKNNTINAVYRAAVVGVGNNSLISGNDFIVGAESCATGRTSVITVKASTGNVTITNNTFSGANRAIAVDNAPNLSAGKLTISNNRFINTRYAFELGSTINKDCGTYNLSKNYYTYDNKVSALRIQDADKTSNATNPWAVEYKGDKVNTSPYYSDEALTKLVYAETTDQTVIDAVAKAITDTNTALKVALSDQNKTLENLTAENLADAKLKADPFKTAIGAVTQALGAVPPTALETYLNKNSELKKQVELLRQLYTTAFTIEAVAEPVKDAVKAVATPTLPAGAPAVTTDDVKQAVDGIKADVAKAIKPEGLTEAFGDSFLNEAADVQVYLEPALTDIVLEATIVTSPDGTKATVLIPQSISFEIAPSVKKDGETVGREIKNSELSGDPISFRIPIPKDVTASYARIEHVFSDGSGSEILWLAIKTDELGGKYVQVTVKKFSTFNITFTNTLPSSGSSGGGGSRPSSLKVLAEEDFWNDVISRVKRAEDGTVIKVNATKMENVPSAVLKTLYGKDVTLVISHKGNETILSGLEMKAPAKNHIYYTFADLYQLYAERTVNLETGNTVSGEKYIPVTGGYIPNVTQATITLEAPDVAALEEVSKETAEKAIPIAQPKAAVVQPVQPRRASMPLLPVVLAVSALAIGAVAVFLYRRRNQA